MSNNRKRQSIVGFRVTPEEEAKIRAASKREGCSIASFARQVVVASSEGRRLELADSYTTALRDFTAEVQRIGLVTRKRVVTEEAGERIVDELRRLQRTVLRLREDGPVK
jgi:hypothetical protein